MTRPDLEPGVQSSAAEDLLRIGIEIEAARRELAQLRREVVSLRAQGANTKAARLLEANEQLVLATLAAQRAAEASEQAVRELAEAAELDPLTRLPNGGLLRARLASAIGSAAGGGAKVALLLLNLADFKLINDTLGHAVGDQVLQLAARNLAAAAGPAATVSRHGSNEFLVLLPAIEDGAEAVTQAAAIVAALGAPSMIDDHVLRLAANAGISIYPQDGADADGLIDRAVAAMYRAKWCGTGSYAFQGESGSTQRSIELRTLESLRQPLINRRSAMVASDKQQELLQQANTQLVLAAIGAQELQAAAEEARRRQTVFLGVLAHELRNPLTPLSNAASLLGGIQLERPVLSTVQAIIERQVKSISRMVEDLLDVSRINAGKLTLKNESVDISSLMDDVVEACRPKLDIRMQRFEIHLPASALTVHGDPVRLSQILTNLLDNASKYTPHHGHIRFAAAGAAGDVVLTVTDDGIGITEQALETVFEPFSQEPHATLFNGAGLGIGLTVVRELVEGHGGHVTASSAGKGLGSQFLVRLPLAAVDEAAPDGGRPRWQDA